MFDKHNVGSIDLCYDILHRLRCSKRTDTGETIMKETSGI